MLTSQYDIIVETLTGSEFEMTVSDKDTIGYIKSKIQKYEGIPIGQQHLLYNHKELCDTTEMKDIPLVNGSRLKLVLDMKGGPVSARRVVNLPDYDNWFDLNDVLNTSSRHDPLTISTPSVKLLVYKDYKKNVHRIMKLRSDRKPQNSTKSSNENATFTSDNNDQWVKDNLQTIEKMHQLRMQLEQKKKNKDNKKQQQQIGIDAFNDDFKKQIEELTENFKRQAFNESQQIAAINKLKSSSSSSSSSATITSVKLSSIQQQSQQRKNNFNEYPIPTLPRRSLSSGILNKYGLNKTCIRPPSLMAQQQQQHQSSLSSSHSSSSQQQKQQSQHHQQQRKNENNFFHQLHALSPLSLPPPGLTLSSTSLSKFNGNEIKSSQSIIAPAISECNIKDGFQAISTAAAAAAAAAASINRPIRQSAASSVNVGGGGGSGGSCCDDDGGGGVCGDDDNTSYDLLTDFDVKAKIRDNIRRNRSFKTINGNGTASDGDLMQYSSQLSSTSLNSPPLMMNNRSLSSMIDQIFGVNVSSSTKRIFEKSNTSKSVQDLVEKFSLNGVKSTADTTDDGSVNNLPEINTTTPSVKSTSTTEVINLNENKNDIGIGGGIRLPKLSSTSSNCGISGVSGGGNVGFENKLFVDRHHYQHHHPSLSLNAIDASSVGGGCSGGGGGSGCIGAADYKLETTAAAAAASTTATTSALDSGSSFRLYKMASTDATNSYELPKLLIREDSPVESFHSSDPQLETLTIRGDTSKQRIDAFPKLNATAEATDETNVIDRANVTGKTTTTNGKTIIKTPWNHHHSDLGLNNLELNFLNHEFTDLDTKLNVIGDNCNLTNGSVLKIASNLEINSNCWNSSISNSSELLDGSGIGGNCSRGSVGSSINGGICRGGQSSPHPSTTTSLNFINGDLTSSDDEIEVDVDEDIVEDEDDDEGNLFGSSNASGGSCCMLHHGNSKSKSIELNDFRMMFGSSPTLLNSTNYNSVTHTSRLDAVPIQYRRGYTNLNDACLSSSTSELELFNSSSSSSTNGVSAGGNVRKKNSSKSASQELPSAFSSARHHSTSHHHLMHHHHHHHLHHHHHHHHHHHKTANSNNSLDFVRSYENLDRAKILRMKNVEQFQQQQQQQHQQQQQQKQQQCNNNNNRSSLLCKGNLKHFWDGAIINGNINKLIQKQQQQQQQQNNFSTEKLQEEDFYIDDEDFTSYANLGFENALITATTTTSSKTAKSTSPSSTSSSSSNDNNNRMTNNNDCRLPLSTGFPSDESLFNMSFDRFTDEFNLLSTMSFNGPIGSGCSNSSSNGGGGGGCGGNGSGCSVNSNIDEQNNEHLLLSSVSPSSLIQSNDDDDDDVDNDVDNDNDDDQSYEEDDLQSCSLMLSEIHIDGKSTIKKISSSSLSKRHNPIGEGAIKKRIGNFTTQIDIDHNNDDDDEIATLIGTINDSGLIQQHKQQQQQKQNENEKNNDGDDDNDDNLQKSQNKQRCAECNKKLGLIMIMKCHCEKIFCPQHRYAEAHNCSYNFKKEGKKILARENPLVVAQKINRI